MKNLNLHPTMPRERTPPRPILNAFPPKQSQVQRTWTPFSMLGGARSKNPSLFQHSFWEDVRVGQWGGRVEHEVCRNCPGPCLPLAHRHHLTTREAITRPPAWMDANVAVASTLPFLFKSVGGTRSPLSSYQHQLLSRQTNIFY